MTEPIFLSFEDVIEIHRDQIVRYGGASGVRDIGLLQSAVLMPLAQFEGKFLHKDLFEMAAAYLFHLAKNHPFVDGNKRVGLVAASPPVVPFPNHRSGPVKSFPEVPSSPKGLVRPPSLSTLNCPYSPVV